MKLTASIFNGSQIQARMVMSRSGRPKSSSCCPVPTIGAARLKAQNIARGIGARLGPANGVALAPLKNLSNAIGMSTAGRRYSPVSTPGDPLLVTVQNLVQGVEVIYRIGK